MGLGLIKYLHKFFNKEDIPWVSLIWEKHYDNGKLPGEVKKGSFWWRDVLNLLDKFKGMAKVQIADGNSCSLWEDLWGDDILAAQCPELFSFAKKKITFANGLAQSPIHSLFHLPLSQEAHDQMLRLQETFQSTTLTDSLDSWHYIWGSNVYSVKKTYKHLTGHLPLHPVYKWLWKCSCQNKHKVFFWLLIKDRLSTREILKRKNMFLQDYNCVLCFGASEESLVHHFLECPFAAQCWAWLQIQLDQSL